MAKTAIKAAPRAVTLAAATSKLRGDTAAVRSIAFLAIATNSFMEDISRGRSIANLRIALGAKPSEVQTLAAKTQWVIGRVASRLPASECAGNVEDGARISFAETIILNYAAPAKEGSKARALRKGQTGRRSAMQHRVIRNAEEAWSQVAAELAIGNATTQKQRNDAKAKRAPQMAGSAKGATPPAHSVLVKPETPVDADAACAHLMTQSRALLDYANKYAKLIPNDFGMACVMFHSATLKAHQERAKA